MGATVDARGFSCPQPVMMTLRGIDSAGENTLLILVDTEASKENVSRAAASRGWMVSEVQEEDGEYRITIRRE